MDSQNQEKFVNTTESGMASIRKTIDGKKDSAQFDIGQVIAERYTVVKILGYGGFGIVYECSDSQQDGRHVALKTLKHNIPDYTRAAKRFEREIELSQELASEHTVRVFDAGVTENDTLYFVMELLTGETLEAFVSRHERFSFLETKKLILQVLESLKEAHHKGVVHRDLKPSNISLEPVEGNAEEYGSGHEFNVRVLDFGIAKIIDTEEGPEHAEKLTKTGAWIGSPGYMSPELPKGGEVTPAADIYALGIIMFEMLVAHQAIYGASAIEIAVQQMGSEPLPIDDWILESAFGPVISRCLDKDRDKRYQDAEELYQAVLALDDSQLIKDFTAAKLRSFASMRRTSEPMVAPSMVTGVNSMQMPSIVSMTGVVSEEEMSQRHLQQGLIFGIALCIALIVTVVVLKVYVDKRVDLGGILPGAAETVELKQHQKDILQSASLGALMGALEPWRVRITVAASPAETKIYRASDNEEIGSSGSVFELIRSMSQWKLILRADGYEDYILPVTPARHETLTVTLNRKLPPRPNGAMPPWMNGQNGTQPPPPVPVDPQNGDKTGNVEIPSQNANAKDAETKPDSKTETKPTDTKTTTSTSGTKPTDTKTSGTKTSGTKTSGTKTSGTKTSGTKTSGTKTSGTKTSGTKNVYSVD